MTKIDSLDRNIIEQLQINGAQTNVAIAKLLNTSEATIRRRRERLEKEDVIRVVAVANPFKLGFEVMAIIGIQTQQNKLADVEHALAKMPQVRFLGMTLGTYDLMLETWHKTNGELMTFITEMVKIEGIKRTESFQIMRLSKYTYDWGTPIAAKQPGG